MKEVKINVNPVANRYAGSTEHIIEYTGPNGAGGLVSFIATDTGVIVNLYRHDPQVDIRVNRADGPGVTPSNQS